MWFEVGPAMEIVVLAVVVVVVGLRTTRSCGCGCRSCLDRGDCGWMGVTVLFVLLVVVSNKELWFRIRSWI